MKLGIVILLLIGLLLALPFVAHRPAPVTGRADHTLIVVTPHPESIRSEFARGFAEWFEERTGETVAIDYRIGGTGEISRLLQSEFANSFRLHWTRNLGREWTLEAQESFSDPRIDPGTDSAADTPAEAVRRAFLESDAGAGIDVFFGGGVYDFTVQAGRGFLIDAGLLEAYPDWFMDSAEPGTVPPAIPGSFAGETFFDPEGRWYGACLSSYGIIFNRPALRRLGIRDDPRQWRDLADPRLAGQVAVSDPTMSGSITQAFEMIVQQQMQQRLRTLEEAEVENDFSRREQRAIEEGWLEGMRLIQLICANARYFTDSSQKPNIDVAMGDCAAGMSIDFYARFQADNVFERSGDRRMGVNIPPGGTTISADPVGMLRGAPNPKVARLFVEFVLSLEGQKLWNFRPGTPGGPGQFALRRLPIRPELYGPEFADFRSDPELNPYQAARDFQYHRAWTGHLFDELRSIIRAAFIDVRPELTAAWAAIRQARSEGRESAAERGYAMFSDLTAVDYDQAVGPIRQALRGSPLEEVRLLRDLSDHFRQRFREAERLANQR